MHVLLSLSFLLAQGPANQADLPPGAIARLGSTHFRHPSHAGYAALSPDGKLLVSVAGNDGMRIWDVATGRQLLFHPRLKTGYFGAALFSPDGRLLASRREKALVLWDVAKREVRFELPDEKSSYHAPTFSADGRFLATYSNDGRTRVWDTVAGKLNMEWETGSLALAFTADGKTVITDKRQGLRFWDAGTGKVTREIKLSDDFYLVTLLALAPKNDLLAIGEGPHHQNGERKTPMYFRIHDMASGKERYRIAMKWEDGFVSALAFAPDGKTMVLARRPLSGSAPNCLETREVASGKLLRTVPLPDYNYHSLSFTADGKTLAVAGEELIVRLFRYPDFMPHLPPVGHTKPTTVVAYAPDGKRAYSAGEDHTLIAWDLKTAKPLHTWPVSRGVITDAFPTSDGRFLAVPVWTSSDNLSFDKGRSSLRARNGVIEVRQLPDGKPAREIGPVSGGVAVSPDGRTLLAGDGPRLRLWDLATGESRHKLEGHAKDVLRVAFSPDSQHVASVDGDGFIHVWRASGGKPTARLSLASEDSRTFFTTKSPILAFTPDGRHLISVTSNWSTMIEVWEVATGQRADLIKLDKKRVEAPALLTTGRTLLLCDRGDGLQLLDLTTGETLPKPFAAAGRVTAVALAPDRRTLITTGEDGFLFTWKSDALNAPATDGKPSEKDLTRYLQILGGTAKSAYGAHWDLVRGGDSAVKFLGDKLGPVVGPDSALVAQRLAELDSTDFKIRDKANLELGKWGKAVEFNVRKALTEKRPLEGRRRLEELLATIDTLPEPPETLRMRRALAVLEAIGTSTARNLLQKMADGAPGSCVTVDAKASLQRLRP